MIAKEKDAKKDVKEMTGEAYGRIDGLINRRLLDQLFNIFDEIYSDLVEADEMFPVSDLVDYVCQEIKEFSTQGMSAEIDLDESTGPSDKSEPEDDIDNVDYLATPDAKANDYGSEVSAGANEDDVEGKEDAQVAPMFEKEDQHGNLFQALADLGSEMEIQQYLDSVGKEISRTPGKNDYAGWTEDDYIEDFKNYIADKALQEHFGRFLKDYQ